MVSWRLDVVCQTLATSGRGVVDAYTGASSSLVSRIVEALNEIIDDVE